MVLQLLAAALDVGRPPTRRAKIEVKEHYRITSRALLPGLLDEWLRFADARDLQRAGLALLQKPSELSL